MKLLFSCRGIIPVLAVLMSLHSQDAISQPQSEIAGLGAKVTSAKTDGHSITVTVENVSKKDITAVHIATQIRYRDGKTGAPQWEWDLASAKADRDFRSNHHMPILTGPSQGVLRPRERAQDSLEWTMYPDNPLVDVSANIDLVLYADGTSDVPNQEALNTLLRRRRGLANAWGPSVEFESGVAQADAPPSMKRQAKNESFNRKGSSKIEKLPNASFFPELPISNSINIATLPALPILESDAIVIGKVDERQAFFSQDKTAVYSEAQFAVEQVLKAYGDVASGSAIVVQRTGGIVRFQDGSIQTYRVPGEDWPLSQRRYLMFLKRSQAGDFDILTGYELCGGITYPLDGVQDKKLPFAAYSGMKEMDFMNIVNNAIKGGN